MSGYKTCNSKQIWLVFSGTGGCKEVGCLFLITYISCQNLHPVLWLLSIPIQTQRTHCFPTREIQIGIEHFYLFIRAHAEHFILRWALSTLQWHISAILCICALIICDWISDCSFTQHILNIHQSGYSTVWNCRCLGANYVYTIQLCTSLQYYLIQSHTGRLHVCLAKTCHLHIWQNDQDLSRAAAVKWRWNRYQNKSQHRKLTVEKKILPLLLPGFEPKTLQSWVFPLFRHMFTHVVTIFNHIQCVTSV